MAKVKVDYGSFPRWMKEFYKAFGSNFERLHQHVWSLIEHLQDDENYDRLSVEWTGEVVPPENLARNPKLFFERIYEPLRIGIFKTERPERIGEVINFMAAQFFYKDPIVYQATESFESKADQLAGPMLHRLPLPADVFCVETPEEYPFREIYCIASRQLGEELGDSITVLSLLLIPRFADMENDDYIGTVVVHPDGSSLEETVSDYLNTLPLLQQSKEEVGKAVKFLLQFLLYLAQDPKKDYVKTKLPNKFRSAETVRRVSQRIVVGEHLIFTGA